MDGKHNNKKIFEDKIKTIASTSVVVGTQIKRMLSKYEKDDLEKTIKMVIIKELSVQCDVALKRLVTIVIIILLIIIIPGIINFLFVCHDF